MWHLVCLYTTWRLGCRNESGILSRPMRQVALGSALTLDPPKRQVARECTQAPGGARVFQAPCGVRAIIANQAFCQDLNARWRWSQPLALDPPKHQVVHGCARALDDA
ncbi:hypothetical protein NC652_034710 [Populus alba x Populus x berolinensis]|nr:hypothetical protein NC652_034710 [Populus alba x Populus x berolinensis]